MFNIFKIFSSFASRSTVTSETEAKIQRDWNQIKILLAGKSPSQLRQALITADKSLDNALRDIVAGTSMGERLKNAVTRFEQTTYNRIWDAHKLRNNLVHESGFEPPHFMLTEGVQNLKDGLLELGVKV